MKYYLITLVMMKRTFLLTQSKRVHERDGIIYCYLNVHQIESTVIVPVHELLVIHLFSKSKLIKSTTLGQIQWSIKDCVPR